MDDRPWNDNNNTDRVVPAFVLRLRAGDPQTAWTLFLGEFTAALQKLIRRFAHDEDSLSDCFVFVCEHLRAQDCRRLSRFEPDGSARFTTWLHSVTWNLCLDWKRTQRPRMHLVTLDDVDVDAAPEVAERAPAFDPAAVAEAHDGRVRLARAMDRLPAEDRLLVRLRYEKELTLAELARVTGLQNAQAVDRRLRSILVRLERDLASAGPEKSGADTCHESEARAQSAGRGDLP